MDYFLDEKSTGDQFSCLGNFDAHNKFCRRACALSLRCIIEQNRFMRMEQLADLFDWEDVEPVNMQ